MVSPSGFIIITSTSSACFFFSLLVVSKTPDDRSRHKFCARTAEGHSKRGGRPTFRCSWGERWSNLHWPPLLVGCLLRADPDASVENLMDGWLDQVFSERLDAGVGGDVLDPGCSQP